MMQLARGFVALSKPRIVALLVFTAACGMWKAAEGMPEASVVLVVLLGGALAAAGANAVNQGLESDIDAAMRRTRGRPVASHRIDQRLALAAGTGAIVVAALVMGLVANWLSAGLTLGAAAIYVFIYTLLMKRRSWNNIVIGGAAGALPPLIGTAAVTGIVDAPGLYMFGLVFFWTPPHFWALSLLLKDDYAAARIPMLPTVAGVEATSKQIVLYVALLIMLGWMPVVAGYAGVTFAVVATVLGAEWARRAWLLLKDPSLRRIRRTYTFSLLYIAGAFLALAVEPLLPWYDTLKLT